MATTRATQIGKMVSAIVNQKPSDFADTFSTVFKGRITQDKDSIETNLKANMFKQGDHSVDFDQATGREEAPPQELPPTVNKEEGDIMSRFMGDMNKSLETMYKDDKTRTLDPDENGGSDGGS